MGRVEGKREKRKTEHEEKRRKSSKEKIGRRKQENKREEEKASLRSQIRWTERGKEKMKQRRGSQRR